MEPTLVGPIRFSSDDSTIVAVARGCLLHLDSATLHGKRQLKIQEAFNPTLSVDGTRLAMGGYLSSDAVTILDTSDLRELVRFKRPGSVRYLHRLAFSPSTEKLACSASDGAVRVVDVSTGNVASTVFGHDEEVTAMAFNPDETLLATASDDGTCRVWKLPSGKEHRRFETRQVRSAKATPVLSFVGPSHLLSVGVKKDIQVLDLFSGKIDRVLLCPTYPFYSALEVSADGTCVISGNAEGHVQVWSTTTDPDLTGSSDLCRLSAEREDEYGSILFDPNGQLVILADFVDSKGLIRIWDAATGAERLRWQAHEGRIASLAISADGEWLVSGGVDAKTKVWDVTSGILRWEFLGHAGTVVGAAISRNGRHVISSGYGRTRKVVISTVDDEQKAITLPEHASEVRTLAFAPVGDLVTTATSRPHGVVRIWDKRTGKKIHTWDLPTMGVRRLVWSHDAKRLAASSDGRVCVLDVLTKTVLCSLKGHESSPGELCFSHDGNHILTSARDGTTRFWDVNSGKLLRTYFDSGAYTEFWEALLAPPAGQARFGAIWLGMDEARAVAWRRDGVFVVRLGIPMME